MSKLVVGTLTRYSPDQPRSSDGRFTSSVDGGDKPNFDIANIHVLGADHLTTEVNKYLIDSNGKYYSGQPLPDGITPGVRNHCYQNASQLVMMNQEVGDKTLQYCEGVATKPEFSGLAILHGWAVDKEGNVIDNTLSDPENWQYYGVTYPWDKYSDYMFDNQVYGVLGGSDAANEVIKNGGI